MKKMLTILTIGAIVASASADLTGFVWVGGVATDKDGATFAAGGVTAHTVLNLDLATFVFDNAGQLQIDIANIPVAYSVDDLGIAPAFLGGKYGMALAIEGDYLSIAAPKTAYLVLKTGVGAIEVNDFIGLGASGVIVDLQPGADPAAVSQEFAAGNVQTNIQVIPEPATFGLMAVAGLGMFLARKKARR